MSASPVSPESLIQQCPSVNSLTVAQSINIDQFLVKTPYPQFVLFGDSITQQAFDQTHGFAAAAQLANDYIRRYDVINRGFSGYNTDWALKILPEVFALGKCGKIDYITVLFGANDACNAGTSSRQDVPLPRFKSNLKAILTHPNILAHNPRIILITTPPVDEYQLKDDYRPDGLIDKGRSAEKAQAYAEACREVGEELIKEGKIDLAICDLWSTMMDHAEWRGEYKLPGSLQAEQNSHFSQMLHDGLHFHGFGYRLFYKALRQTLAERWPDSHPDGLQKHFPEWTAWLESLPVDGAEEDN